MISKDFSQNFKSQVRSLSRPGVGVFDALSHYAEKRRARQRRQATEKALSKLGNKVERILQDLDETTPLKESPPGREDECIICFKEKATIRTEPCCHKVLCQKCFLKTVSQAIAKKAIPLKCVMCKIKITQLTNEQIKTPSRNHSRVSSSTGTRYMATCNNDVTTDKQSDLMKPQTLVQPSNKRCPSTNFRGLHDYGSRWLGNTLAYTNPTFVDDQQLDVNENPMDFKQAIPANDINGNFLDLHCMDDTSTDPATELLPLKLLKSKGKKRVRFAETSLYYV